MRNDTMEIQCKLRVVNRQGGVTQVYSWGSIIVRNMNNKSTLSEEELSIIVPTSPNSTFIGRYNLTGNIEGLSTQFLIEDQVTVSLKEPSYNICITNADLNKLTIFMIYLKKLLPEDLPPHASIAALEQTIPKRDLYLGGQEKYKLRMEFIIIMDTNLDQFTDLEICDCTLELEGDQLPIADAIKRMKNLTTLRLERIELRSSIFLEIESKKLKKLHLCYSNTPLPIASLFKNDLCYKDSLVELYLKVNHWSEVPNGIFQFQNLLKLSLENNLVTELPDKFTNLPKLQVLDLSHNQLTHVPPSIFALQNLLELDLDFNDITELADMFANLSKLKSLMLNNNQLRHIPSSIFACQNLFKLSLRGNYITELPDKFINLPKLQELPLSNNQLQYLPPSIFSLHLQKIDIDDNEFNFGFPPSVGSEMVLHSLKELSYRAILKHKLQVKEGMLPNEFLKVLDNYHQCICGRKFVDGQELAFFSSFSYISNYTFDVRHLYSRVPVRGKMCTSLKTCFQDRFTKFR